jgi:hypothetical protein
MAKVELGLSAQRIYQDLVGENGFTDSYQSVKRFVRKLRTAQPERIWRSECEPGEELQLSFPFVVGFTIVGDRALAIMVWFGVRAASIPTPRDERFLVPLSSHNLAPVLVTRALLGSCAPVDGSANSSNCLRVLSVNHKTKVAARKRFAAGDTGVGFVPCCPFPCGEVIPNKFRSGKSFQLV